MRTTFNFYKEQPKGSVEPGESYDSTIKFLAKQIKMREQEYNNEHPAGITKEYAIHVIKNYLLRNENPRILASATSLLRRYIPSDKIENVDYLYTLYDIRLSKLIANVQTIGEEQRHKEEKTTNTGYHTTSAAGTTLIINTMYKLSLESSHLQSPLSEHAGQSNIQHK